MRKPNETISGDGRFDAMGSIAIGLVLITVAIFLAKEVKSLLIGERADEDITIAINNIIASEPNISNLIHCKTIQQGPGEVLVCMKIKCNPILTSPELSLLINNFEKTLRNLKSEVKWIYIEPDLQEWRN